MGRIKILTTNIVASFDAMISQIENHDALTASAITDVNKAGGRAKVQLQKVKRDGQRMRQQLAELTEQEQLWKDRAVKAAQDNEEQALECVRRSKRAAQKIKRLETEQLEHSKLEKQLTKDLSRIDEQLNRLRDKRNILRTRESRAQALRLAQGEDTSLLSDIENIFDRWETKVAEYEYEGGCFTSLEEDELEFEFKNAEETAELKEELKELLSTGS